MTNLQLWWYCSRAHVVCRVRVVKGSHFLMDSRLAKQWSCMSGQFLLMHDIGHDLASGVSLSQEWSLYTSWLLFCLFEHQDIHLSQEWPLYASYSLRSASLTIQTSISLRSGLPMSTSLSSVLDHPHNHLSQEWHLYVSVTIVV